MKREQSHYVATAPDTMGKLAVFLFAVVAAQAAFGAVLKTRADELDKLNNLAKQILTVSEDVVGTLHKTTRCAFNDESREFGERIEEIINKLEELKNKSDHQVETIETVLQNLREVLSTLKKLSTTTDSNTVSELKTQLTPEIKTTATQLQLLAKSAEETNVEDTILKIFLNIFNKYSQSIQSFQNKITGTGASSGTSGQSPRDVVKKIEESCGELYVKIQEAESTNTENDPMIREFMRDLGKITERLEKIQTKSDNADIKGLVEHFRSILIFLNKFANHEGVSVDTLKTYLDNVPQTFEKLLQGETSHSKELKDLALQFISVTKRYRYGILSDFHPRYGRSEYTRNGRSAGDILRDLGDSLKHITHDDNSVKLNLVNMISEYIENLSEIAIPDFEKHASTLSLVLNEGLRLPLNDIKMHIYTFVNNFNDTMEKMSQSVVDKFWKATHKLQIHVDNVRGNEHSRYLSIRIRTFSDLITSMLQTISTDSSEVKQDILVQQREFTKTLEKILLRLEKTAAPRDIVTNVRGVIGKLGNDVDLYKLVTFVEVATTEFEKLLVVCGDNKESLIGFVSEYFNALQWQWHVLLDIYGKTQDIQMLTMHVEATTNKLGTYYRGDRYTDEVRDLHAMLQNLVDKLESESTPNELKKVLYRLKQVAEQFESNHDGINDLLQRIAAELKTLTWVISDRKDNFHNTAKELVMNYWVKLQRVHMVEKFHKGTSMVQTRPVEAILEIETTANQLTKSLRLTVPEYQQTRFAYQGRHLVQILDLALFRLSQITKGSANNLVAQEVPERLRQIQKELQTALSKPDISLKIKLGVFVQNVVMELKRWALDTTIPEDTEIEKVFGELWFGLKHIQVQIQYNLQVVITKGYSVKTLAMQLQTIAHRLSIWLQRTQLKPELKRVVFTQIDIFAREIGYLVNFLQEIGGDKDFQQITSKLNRIYEEFEQVAKTGSNKSVVELTAFLDTYVQTVVMDLETICYSEQLKTPQFNEIYRRFLSGITNINIRLQNVHYYEYYNKVDARQMFDHIQKLTSTVISKLGSDLSDSKEVRFDFAIQILKYVARLNKVAENLKYEARIDPKNLREISLSFLQLVRQTSGVSTNEIQSKLSSYLRNVNADIEKSWGTGNNEGAKKALTRYLVSVEKLFIHVQHIWVRTQHDESTRQVILHLLTHVSYFTNVLERVNPSNKDATEILRTEYRRFVEDVTAIAKNMRETSGSSTKWQHVVDKLSEIQSTDISTYKNVDDIKINLALQLNRASWSLWDIFWIVNAEPKSANTEGEIKPILKKFLNTVQHMHILVDTRIVVPQGQNNYSQSIEDTRNTYGRTPSSDAENQNRSFDKWSSTKQQNVEDLYPGLDGHQGHIKAYQGSTERKFQSRVFGDEYGSDYSSQNTNYKSGSVPEYNRRTYQVPANYEDVQNRNYPSTWNNFETPKYNQYKNTKNLDVLVNEIKKVSGDVSAYLRNAKVQRDIEEYVRELVEIIANVIKSTRTEEARDYSVRQVVRNLKNLKYELSQICEGIVSPRPDQVKYELADAIERVVFDLERLTRLVQGDTQALNTAFGQILNFIRNVKSQTKVSAYGSSSESGQTVYNVNPWTSDVPTYRVPTSSNGYRRNSADTLNLNWNRPTPFD